MVFQYNLVGPLRADAYGYEIEDRSSGTILRYNEVIQGAGGAAFWFVQTTGGIGVIDTDPAISTEAGGAWVIRQPEFTPEALGRRVRTLAAMPAILEQAGRQAAQCGIAHAATRLADLVEQTLTRDVVA